MNMDTYLYLLLTLSFLALWMGIWMLRKDLRAKMQGTILVGAVAGVLAELWYFRDYWRPPTILGIAKLSPEDAFIGIGLVGVGMTIYDVLLQTTDVPGERPRCQLFLALFIAGLASLQVHSTVGGMNSANVIIVTFALCALVMIILRPDLLKVSIVSGLAMCVIGFLLYLILFTWRAPHYWQTYWLLAGTRWDVMIFNIPLTEIAWYISWGMLAGIAHNFSAGKIKKPL